MHVPNRYRFASARLPEGWKHDVLMTVAEGVIVKVEEGAGSDDATAVSGAAIAGMPNVHSHAFQRAMAGLAESRSTQTDSFWTWRETMYAVAQRMTPELLNAVAAQLYVEMLKVGYTRVCEFHYLHNQSDGSPYADRTITSHALIDAASSAAIGLTLLPTLYQTSAFGAVAPTIRQRQFIMDTDDFIQRFESLRSARSDAVVGMALHSLRAVPPAALSNVLESSIARESPVIHIHIAEQLREVEECIRVLGQRPIEWLLDHAELDARWCLVHATHSAEHELKRVAGTGAVVGLCPTTEANLGDGVFHISEYARHEGCIAIGSDSHISISAAEELRWLEYQARLSRQERNVLATAEQSSGARLWEMTASGGAQASGIRAGALVEGHAADIVVLDTESAMLAGRTEDALLDTFIFSGQPNAIRDVMVNGRWVVQNGHHFAEIPIEAAYKRAMRVLFS
ncbi:MAG: formimidoylglutamate deiminase [Povalibacter sp.]